MKNFINISAIFLTIGMMCASSAIADNRQQRGTGTPQRNERTRSTSQKTAPARPATSKSNSAVNRTNKTNGQRQGATQVNGNNRNKANNQADNKAVGRQPANRQPASSVTPSGTTSNRNGQRPGAAGVQPRPGNTSGNNNPFGNNGPVVHPGTRPPANNAGPSAVQRPGASGNRVPGSVPRPQPNNFRPRPPQTPFYVNIAPPRPTPPTTWRMPARPLSFGEALLGLTLGTAFNASLNYFYNNGYVVGGYAADAIYLRNVEMMNFYWPEATLFYNAGVLASTVYAYSTGYNDSLRYNSLLSKLTKLYGYPYVSRTNSALTAQWWGPAGGFVTLSYQPTYSPGGGLRYYTTLTFGN